MTTESLLYHASVRHPAIRLMIETRKGASTPTEPPHNTGRTPNTDPAGERILVEGLWSHEFLLAHDADIEVFTWGPELAATERDPQGSAVRPLPGSVRQLAGRAGTALEISAKTMARLTSRRRTEPMVSLVRLPSNHPYSNHAALGRLSPDRIAPSTVLLVADGVEYAGNLGALIRVVDACGASGMLLTNRRARLAHPMVFTASRGAVLTTPVLDFDSVPAAQTWLTGRSVRCSLADPDGNEDYRTAAFASGPTALVVGSEGRGLSRDWYAGTPSRLTIPMRGSVDSLNVAVAAGVLLFEAVRAPRPLERRRG